jgi:hypothetical protein
MRSPRGRIIQFRKDASAPAPTDHRIAEADAVYSRLPRPNAKRPARGTACVTCRADGHFCQATVSLDDDGRCQVEVYCQPCIDRKPCSAILAERREAKAI